MLKKRFFASCLAALLLLGTLCGCGRTVRLSSGETFTVVKIQSGSTEYGYGPRGIPATIPENFPAPACTIENLSVPLRLRNYSEPEDSFSKGRQSITY